MTRAAMNISSLALATVALAGCASSPPSPHTAAGMEHGIVDQVSYQRFALQEPLEIRWSRSTVGRFNAQVIFMADQIERNVDRKSLDNTLIVTTISNLNNLAETSNFGRLFSENLIHELQVRKWKVFETRLARDIIINGTGEFSLSRDVQQIRDTYKIGGILTGTYSATDGHIIVNARILDLTTGMIAASGQIHLSSSWFTDALLKNEERLKPMKIVGDAPAAGRMKPGGVDLETSKWIKIDDIAK